jgi:diguanylate cyclase
MRSRTARLKTVLWLDAAIGALALSAVSAGAVIGPVVASTGGSTAAVVTNLAYPIGDLLVLAMVLSVFAISGWRPDRSWLVIGAAFAAQAVVDTVYLYQSTAGDGQPGTLLDLGWALNVLLLGLAAWTRPRPVLGEGRAEWLTMLMPAAFTLVAVGVLVYGTQTVERFSILATALATATLLAASVRGAVTVRHMREMSERHDRAVDAALTDHLTGLRNNRAFHEDLAREVERVGPESPLALVMLDLVGLKATNDRLGHQAGDERLQTLARGLTAVLRRGDSAYRVGGDEFAVVLPGVSAWNGYVLAERLQRALSGGFSTVAPVVSVGLASGGRAHGQGRPDPPRLPGPGRGEAHASQGGALLRGARAPRRRPSRGERPAHEDARHGAGPGRGREGLPTRAATARRFPGCA